MPRRLIVMRHAKSSWETSVDSDHARPLNKRGRRDAPRVAAQLASCGWLPEVVLSSDSLRTRQTWQLMEQTLEVRRVEYLDAFYLAGVDAVRRELPARLRPEDRSALLLGHNPGWEELVAWLSGEQVELTTGNAALLSSDCAGWGEGVARPGQWTLEDVVRPKDLGDED